MRYKCLAAFIVFVLFFSITGTIIFAQTRSMLSANFINQILKEANFYDSANQLLKTIATSDKSAVESKILLQSVGVSINPTNFQQEIEKNLPQIMNYLNNQGSLENISFDLRTFKNNFSNIVPNDLSSIIDDQLNSLPPCPEDFVYESPLNLTCLPVSLPKDQIKADLLKSFDINQLLDDVPDTYKLSDITSSEKTFKSAKTVFNILKWGFWINLVLSIILILLLIILGLKYWPSIPRWVGFSLALPSAVLLIFGLLSNMFSPILITQISQSLSSALSQLLIPIIETVNHKTVASSLLISGIVFAVGIVLIIISYAVPHPPEPKPAENQIPPQPKPQSKTNV